MVKVSVIVPVYNVEKYISKCLDSLVLQTLKEIEVIVVNDGSTDDSQSIIDRYSSLYPTIIKAYVKPNGGLSDARNFGIEKAVGEYYGFVDSDDYVDPNMFKSMLELASTHNAEIVICNLQKVNENGEVTQKLVQIPNMPEKIVLKDNFSVFSDLSYFACNKLFHKSLFAEKRFKVGVHFEDIQLVPQLLLKSKIIAQTQKYFYNYFERSDSISKTHTLKGLDILNAVDEVGNEFQNSIYKDYRKELHNFKILEGVYTFLAYLAFVKDEKVYQQMAEKLSEFMIKNSISLTNLLLYKRFGKNYLLSLPLRKQLYYFLYFFGGQKVIRKMMNKN